MELMDLRLSSLLFIIPLIHLTVSPHTKVEESFNLQATHDILVYGTPTRNIGERFAAVYDHFTFPGAVPRSFIGSVVLSGVSQPVVALFGFQHAQFIVRAVLGGFNAGCLLFFRNSLAEAYGKGVARWWILLLVSQFHVVYYLSRTLPNMFAFGLTTLAFACLLPRATEQETTRRRKQAIAALTFSAAVFRAELAILLFTTAAYLFLSGRASIRAIAPVFAVSFVGSLVLSMPIDSYFWQRWIWPELAGFYYNAVLGSSANWGVSPFHYYFTSALPRLFINPMTPLLALLALAHPGTAQQARPLALPSLLFVAIYSLQPHKEARFIFYVVPPLTAVGAIGAHFVFLRRSKSLAYRLATHALAASIPCALALSSAMLLLSSLNYPGGDALVQLQSYIADHPPVPTAEDPSIAVAAHADVLTCMTGLSLFGQNPFGLPLALADLSTVGPDHTQPLLLIDKTETGLELGKPSYWDRLEYALEENPALPVGDWEVLGVVQGFNGIEILRPNEGDDGKKDAILKKGEDNILGLGNVVTQVRERVRAYTGGWWIGPRMSPRIRIMRKFERV